MPEPRSNCNPQAQGAQRKKRELTNPHNHKEARQKPSKVNNPRPSALHEIIGVGCAPAYEVRQRRNDVCRDDEESEVVFEERGGEDDEEEAYCQNLYAVRMRLDWGFREAGCWL
jgi:hypothetical protein